MPGRALVVLSLLGACQDPFGTDRHWLEGDRIAAVSVRQSGGDLEARAALVVGGALWSDQAVDLYWHWVDATTDAVEAAPAAGGDAQGPRPSLPAPDGARRLAVVAVFPSGTVRRAFVDVSADVDHAPLSGITTEGLTATLDGLEGEDLALELRRGWATTPTDFVPVGGFARLTATFEAPPPAETRTRWMATAPHGTFLELDAVRADWAAGDVVLDDLELEAEPVPVGPGPRAVLALAITRTGANAFTATELWVGPPPTGVWTSSGRWLAADAAIEGTHARGVLAADDTAPTGLRLDLAEAVTYADDDPAGTEGLACAIPVSGPFDPTWLADGTCTRAAVLGAEVVVELR